MKRTKSVIHTLCATLLLAGVNQSSASILVKTEPVKAAIVMQNNLYIGKVVGQLDADIAAQISTKIESVARVGEQFKAGEIIVRLDNSRWLIQRDSQQAEINRIKADLAYRNHRLTNWTQLSAKQAVSKDEKDQLDNEVKMLQQSLKIAQFQLDEVNWNIEKAIIKAPFDGVIVTRHVDQGEYATVGQQMVRLVNTAEYEISVAVPSKLASQLKPGHGVTIKDDFRQFDGTVRAVVLVSDTADKVELRIATTPALDPALVIGRNVRVGLHVPSELLTSLVSVPRDALIFKETGTFVAKVDQQHKVKLVKVEISGNFGENLNIQADLNQQDQVIIRGGDNLADGSEVTTKTGAKL